MFIFQNEIIQTLKEALQRYSVTVPKSMVDSQKLTLYLCINIEVFLGYGKAFREL